MIISHSKKFIFIKTNKTASTSLQVFLSQFLDKDKDIISKGLEEDNKKIYELSRIKNKDWAVKSKKNFLERIIFFKQKIKYFNHDTSIKDIINFYDQNTISNYHKITIVRNPFEQIISSINWHNYFRTKYVNKNEVPVSKLIGNYSKKFFQIEKEKLLYKGEIFMDQIIKYENLENDINKFLKIKKLKSKIDIKNLQYKTKIPKKIHSLNKEQKKIIFNQAEFFFSNFYPNINTL